MVIFDKQDVGNRISQLQQILGLKNVQFAQALQGDPSYFSKVKKGHQSLSRTFLEAIEATFKVNRQWLLFGTGDIFQNGQNIPYNFSEKSTQTVEEQHTPYKHQPKKPGRVVKLQLSLKKRGRTPTVSNDPASPGTVVFNNDDPELVVEYINVPFIGWVDGVVEMAGDSMRPTFKAGDRIAIKRLDKRDLLNWGECYYIIDTNWQGVVKRVFAGTREDYVVLQSDHEDQVKYPPVKRKWKDIAAVFKVAGAIVKC